MTSSNPYWWEAAPLTDRPSKDIAPSSDVVVIGAGYTGLSAALTLARAGRSVQVFEKDRPGEGASSRNGGITSGNLRPSLADMSRSFGEERARAILAEAKTAREDLYRFIREEKIDCDFSLVGKFGGAVADGDYEALARDADQLRKTLGIEAYAVPRSEQRDFIGTNFYKGGNVRMDIGGLHPGKLLNELLRLALEAGVVVHARTEVLGFKRSGNVFEVDTTRGKTRATDLVTGTDAYATRADQWLRRRLVPVRSRIIATEPLPPALMRQLMPRQMMLSETRKLSYYYRPSPDGQRILFGGRDGTIAGEPSWPTENLRRALGEIFPELRDTALSHSWYGYVAMNRDMIPRIFSHRGVEYAVGYCGSGVVWARWAGQQAAFKILGDERGTSALDFRPPPAVPLFNGTAWFMPAYFAWLRLQDRLAARSNGIRT